jgi:CheY-like chemotaxis protein
VSDTGIGIDKSKYHLIFESFTQADNETTRKYGGTGLGLAICKSLIELQGGKIWFESEVGKGTTFYFELPYTPSSGDSVVHLDKKSITRYANEMDGMRILLVEDNDFNRIVASETVKYYFPGVTIETAVNGLDAIKKYRVNDYDLIIMDIQMPEMDGYEATNFIRTQFPEDKRDIHILAMSANALQPDIARVYESGMNDFLPKPFEVNDMALKMSIAYRQKKLKAAGATTING